MTRPDISRHVLDVYATELRRQADASKEIAARAEVDGRETGAEYWTGHARGVMEAHQVLMALLTAGQPQISVGNEVRFLWPSQATPALTNIDSHYDVMRVENGMVAVKRTIYRPRGEMRGAWHWAPLTAVERCTDGHRCPSTAAIIRDRADALHASIAARNAHRADCAKAWCAYCTSLERTANAAYQSAMDAAATVRSAR